MTIQEYKRQKQSQVQAQDVKKENASSVSIQEYKAQKYAPVQQAQPETPVAEPVQQTRKASESPVPGLHPRQTLAAQNAFVLQEQEKQKQKEEEALREEALKALNPRLTFPQQIAAADYDIQRQLEEKLNQYSAIPKATDYAEKSQYVPTGNGEKKVNIIASLLSPNGPVYENSGYDDLLYEYINGNEEAGSLLRQKAAQDWGGDSSLGALYGMATQSEEQSQHMTDEEVGTFNYIYATQGKDAAYDYYYSIEKDLNRRNREHDEMEARQYAAQHPVAASAASVIAKPFAGLSYLNQISDYAMTGSIDQNAPYNKFSYMNTAMRSQVESDIEKTWAGKAGAWGYQLGMSMADSFYNMLPTLATGGASAAVSNFMLAVMGSEAAADTVIDMKDRGFDDDKTFALGTIAGLAEFATERIGMDAFMKAATGKISANSFKQYLGKALLENMGSEGLEEGLSDVINWSADAIYATITDNPSEFQSMINDYAAQGLSERDAFLAAYKDRLKEIGLDVLGGALSGGLFGLGGTVLNYSGDIFTQHNTSNVSTAGQTQRLAPDLGSVQNSLAAAGVDAKQAETLAPIISDILSGEEISGNKAAKIAQNEAAISVLQQMSGAEINADAPLSEVKGAIKALSGSMAASNTAQAGNLSSAGKNASNGRFSASEEGEVRKLGREYVESFADSLDENGKKAFIDQYQDDYSATKYITDMWGEYLQGRSGGEFIPMPSSESGVEQRYQAYLAGQRDANASMQEKEATRQQKIKGVKSVPVKVEGVDDAYSYMVEHYNRATADKIIELADRLGVSLRFVDSVAGGKANAQIYGADVLIEKGNLHPIQYLTGHEFTHRLQDLAPEQYYAFRDAIENDADVQNDIEVIKEAYKAQLGEDLSYDKALDEAAANYAGRLLENGEVLDRFISEHKDDRTLLEKVRDAIRAFVDKLFGVEKTQAEIAIDKLDAAIQAAEAQARENLKNGEAQESDNGVSRYSLKSDVLKLDVDWMDNNSSIKSQLKKHAAEINAMDPVAVVEYSQMTPAQVTTLAMEQLDYIGGSRVKRGNISFAFDKNGIDSIVTHAGSAEEYAAAIASPYVAKYGKLIAGHRNHKGRGNATLTYAAPVVINGDTVNVGVVIMFTNDGKAHAVNVGLQDGGTFHMNKENALEGNRSRVYRYGKGTALPTSSATGIVPQASEESKGRLSQDRDIRYSMKDPSAKYLAERFGVSVNDVKKTAKAIKELDGVQIEMDFTGLVGRKDIETVFDAFKRELIYDGGVDFVGRTFKNANELAVAASVFRDPRFETFRYFFTDDNGRVILNTGVTARIPGVAPAYRSPADLATLFNRATAMGASKVYIMHNHPSGDVTPSPQDKRATQSLSQYARRGSIKPSGSIIIDHDTYTLISEDGSYETIKNDSNGPDPLLKLGQDVHMPKDVRAVAIEANAEEDDIVLIYTNAKGKVTGVQKVTGEYFARPGEDGYRNLQRYLHDSGLSFGAVRIFAYSNKPSDVMRSILQRAYSEGLFTDVAIAGGSTLQQQGVSQAVPQDSYEYEGTPHVAEERFSLKAPVEETDRLMAWHNMSIEALDSAADLGGLAMPSFAVKPADLPHTKYGPVSVMAYKDSIAPKGQSQMIFGGDAWTPTFPHIGYKISDKAWDIQKEIGSILKNIGARNDEYFNDWEAVNIQDALERYSGNFVEAYKKNDNLRLAYATQMGRNIDIPRKVKNFSRDADNETLDKIYNAFSAYLEETGREGESYNTTTPFEPRLRQIMREYYDKRFPELTDKIYPADEALTDNETYRLVHDANRYGDAARRNKLEEVDWSKLWAVLRDIYDNDPELQAGFEKWLEDYGKRLVVARGVRNNKDLFTPSGNRRSFDQLYMAYSLENIVRAMQAQPKQGRTQFLSGAAAVKGAALKSYKSIEDARKEVGRLRHEEDSEAVLQSYKKFSEHVGELAMKVNSDIFRGSEDLAEILSVAKTKDAIYRYLKREFTGFIDVTEDLAQEIYELGQEANTLPMEYLESKLYRAFPFSEAAAIVVPSDTPQTTIDKLNNLGANVLTYEAGDNDDRVAKVNSVEGVRFSLKTPVEEKGSLIALHNLSADKLEKALKLGGFPMPSIAVTKTTIPHTNFGDITLVMNKSAIDPQADRRNTVYSADAWTPTFPQVEYEADEKVASRIRSKFYDLQARFGRQEVDALYSYGNLLENQLDRYGGVAGIIDRERNNTEMKKVYLLDTGRTVPEPVVRETVTTTPETQRVFYDSLIDSLGEDIINEARTVRISGVNDFFNKYEAEITSAFKKYYMEHGASEADADAAIENTRDIQFVAYIKNAARYQQEGPETRKTETDYEATRQAINNSVDQADYEKWLHSMFDGAEARSGIYNGRDRYTPSGNSRSFAAIHYPVTLENIAKAMAGQNDGNSRNVSGFYGVKSLRAGMAKRFASIAEMHELEGRLQHLTEEEADKINEALSDRMTNVMGEIYDTKAHDKFENSFIEMDRIGNILMEITDQKKITVDSVEKVFDEYGYAIGNELAADIKDLLYDVSQMPVNIFEAKPERAIRFDEVLAAVVPSNTDPALEDQLRNAGVQNIMEYEAGNEEDRMAKANSVEGASFSLKGTESTRSMVELANENKELNRKVKEAEKALKAAREKNARLEGQMKLTETPRIRMSDAEKLAKEQISVMKSKADAKKVAGIIKQAGDYILSGGTDGVLTYEDIKNILYDAGREIVENAEELVSDPNYETQQQIKKFFKAGRFYFNNMERFDKTAPGWQKNWSEYRKRHGEIADYNDLRKHNFGRFTLTQDPSARAIDDAWKEAQEMFGTDYFPEEVTSIPDMIYHITELLDSFNPVYSNPYDYNMAEVIEYETNELMNAVLSDAVRQEAPTYADRMANKLQRQKYDYSQKLREVKKQRDEEIQRVKDHYKELREAKAERAAGTRLINLAKRISSMKLTAIDRETRAKILGDLDITAKAITQKKLDNLQDLQEYYENQKANNPDFIPDENIEKMLQRLTRTRVSQLSKEQILDLTKVLSYFEHQVRTQRKAIDSKIKQDIRMAGARTIADIRNTKGSKGGPIDKYFVSQLLSPTREVRRITGYDDSDPLYIATQELADGQRKMFDYMYRASKPFEKWLKDKSFTKSFAGKDAKEVSITGTNTMSNSPVTVKITPAMRASLYLHSLNNQNLRHIVAGGITVPDITLYKKGKIEEAYNKGKTIKLTPTQIRSIIADMSPAERAFARATQSYFNGQSRDEINQTSELLKGYSIAGVENYFPIDTDKSFLKQEFDSIKRDGSIEGMGFLKERVDAANPIMLYDINSILNKSIGMHGKYVGLAVPVSNFGKLWGATKGSFSKEGTFNYKDNVQKAVKQVWGSSAYDYIEGLMRDLAIPAKSNDAWGELLTKARGKYARAVLELNLGVAFKQAASYPAAAAVVGFKALNKALADTHKVDTELVAKYTPLLWYRSQGYSNQELGDLTKRGKVLPKGLNWIQMVDIATTTKLWKAAEYYIRDVNKDLQIGTAAYYKEVAKVYNRIIEETQPNYTAVQRPALLRSSNELVKSLNMFKTQPFQNFNVIYDAIANMQAKKAAWVNTGSQDAMSEYSTAKLDAIRAIASQVAAGLVFALMQFVWDAVRGKDKKYRDEEGDYTVDSIFKKLGLNMLSNGFGMLPFGSEFLNLFEAGTDKVLKKLGKDALFDETYYGLDVSVLDSISDTGEDTLSALASAVDKEANAETKARAFYKAAMDYAKLAGVPAENVTNAIKAVVTNTLKATKGKHVGGYYALRVTSDPAKYPSDYYDLLWKAYQRDPVAYSEIYDLMLEDQSEVFSEDKIRKNMENRMKKAEGVSTVSDLDERYMSPSQQEDYDKALDRLTRSSIWKNATYEQREDARDDLYDFVVDNADGKKQREQMKKYGLSEEEYLLYQIALDMVDQPNKNGKYGTYTNAEIEEAIRMVKGK